MEPQKWHKFTLAEQLANIGSEIERASSWQKKNNKDYADHAFERGLELLDLTISDPRWSKRLKELTRLREILRDWFYGDNEYHTSPEFLSKYFLYFGIAARR